jgi:hypothetical protein
MADLVAKVSELDPHSPPASGSRDAALLPRGSKSMFETIARRRGTNAHDEKYVVLRSPHQVSNAIEAGPIVS